MNHHPQIRRSIFIVALMSGIVLSALDHARAQEPSVPFTVLPGSGAATALPGEEVTFSVVRPVAGTTYVWVFGDGSRPMTGTRVTHTYARVDDVTVQLSAQAGGVQSALGSQVLRVTPQMKGVFASDVDGQFTPADLFQMAVVVRAPGLSKIGVRTAGTLIAGRETTLDVTGGDDFLVLNDMRIADERDPSIRDEIIRKPGGSIAMTDGVFTLALDYPLSSGRTATLSFTPPVRDFFNPDQTIAVTYPQLRATYGMPPEGGGGGDYYLKGDADFGHPDDPYVRALALEWGRKGGAWPDEPDKVATNIFTTIDALFGDGDPAEFNNDYNLARLFEDGTLSKTRKNAAYICIAQAYFFNALNRALGLPAREINNAIGEPQSQRADGTWTVRWWQEAGAEVWYNGAWHYFDTYVGTTDRKGYLAKNLIFQSWAGFDRQATEFRTVGGAPTGLKGHNFGAWPGDPPNWTFIEEGVRPGIRVEGMVGDPPAAAVTAIEDGVAAARPAAAGIASMPMAARGWDETVAAAPLAP